MDTRRELGLFDAFDEGCFAKDVDALLKGQFFNRFVIATATGFVGDRIVVVGFEQGQRCTRFVSPSRLDATPVGFAEDASVFSIAESYHINIIQLAVDERPRIVGGNVHGFDFLERMQGNDFRLPVLNEVYALNSSNLEACTKTLGMNGQFDSVLVVIDQPFFYGFVVFALNVNVLRWQ